MDFDKLIYVDAFLEKVRIKIEREWLALFDESKCAVQIIHGWSVLRCRVIGKPHQLGR
jgi:hypothetical protein